VVEIQVLAGFVDTSRQDWFATGVNFPYIHELYNTNPMLQNNDIALLELTEMLPIDGLKIAPIEVRDTPVTAGTCCIISGWGRLHEDGDSSNILQYASVPILDTTECNYLLTDEIGSGEICAGYLSGGTDSCQIYSGGPLMCEGKLTGIVSWGYGCARKNLPGVYADVYSYRDWIIDKIGHQELLKLEKTRIQCFNNTVTNRLTTYPFLPN
ncbi:hypothetical protein L9F63_023080, partial [Diploptera punctata]